MNPTAHSPAALWTCIALLSAAALLGGYLYLSLKVELRLMARRALTRAELDSQMHALVAEVENLRARLVAAESRQASPPDWTAQSVNLNRRGQILRLHGKGRSPAEIASDLQISQGEVELVVKVNDWQSPIGL